jgi:type 1 glutamine amidotransferase
MRIYPTKARPADLVVNVVFLLGLVLAPRLTGAEAGNWRDSILTGRIKAFCSDFNWGPGGPNGFAKPGLWADADPAEHVAWYEQLGCNVIQTFAVSCNGYAWYKGGNVPEQPGLQHDFLPEMVRLGHQKRLLVCGYFCVGANTRWGREHPELSYGFPSAYHIPFTDAYLDFLSASIEDALKKTGMDGFMIDWVWCPTDEVRRQANGGKWLASEKRLFEQLLAKPYPGEEQLTSEDRLAYERKAIDRCWTRIREAAKRANPACVIWLSCNEVHNATITNSPMLREVDWVMDESGTPAAIRAVAPMFGPRTRQLLCLAGWGDRHKTRELLSDPAMAAFGIYGFSAPLEASSLPLPIPTYLARPIDSFEGNHRGIAALARFFRDQPLDFTESNIQSLVLPGTKGPGEGKHAVLISGDEEYRSEESLPMLAKILAGRHGFKCTVLFAIHKQTGEIDPNTVDNIPGLEALASADLIVICTRFRELPDHQMKHVADYLSSGKPVIGIRPAVVAFRNKAGSRYFQYGSDNTTGDYAGGFGQKILGSTWISHHGAHGKESSRGLPVAGLKAHPILRGVDTMWGPTDVYTIRSPIPDDGQVLVMGQVLQGMNPNDAPSEKPMMPLAWTKSYKSSKGSGRVFMTTMGASEDFLDENFRRLVVNACFWATGLEDRIGPRTDVRFVGNYQPTPFGFDRFRKGVTPQELSNRAGRDLREASPP